MIFPRRFARQRELPPNVHMLGRPTVRQIAPIFRDALSWSCRHHSSSLRRCIFYMLARYGNKADDTLAPKDLWVLACLVSNSIRKNTQNTVQYVKNIQWAFLQNISEHTVYTIIFNDSWVMKHLLYAMYSDTKFIPISIKHIALALS